ncbi:GTP cyclohydrolase I FolE [Psychrilyobacter sp.]|uniref:GTP cyclohydrolase I FolE n=1 Tax=Psychrilyobacter sp. TaxID=2586924 RepID=UPI003017E074
MDKKKIMKGVKLILEGIGEDINREGLLETPDRVARMFGEICGGLHKDPSDEISVFFHVKHNDMVIVKDIQFYSLCEHHLLPFYGKVHIAYIPEAGKVTGLSKLARVVDVASKKPQLQEKLNSEIVEALTSKLGAKGVLVVIEAEHMCMTMRGIQKPGSKTITSGVRGIFRTNLATREEALSLIKHM